MATRTRKPAAINLDALDETQIASLLAQVAERQAAAKAAKAEAKQVHRGLVQTFLESCVGTLTSQTFTSGAEGYSLGGSRFVVGEKSYTVSVLIRDTATIPAKESVEA